MLAAGQSCRTKRNLVKKEDQVAVKHGERDSENGKNEERVWWGYLNMRMKVATRTEEVSAGHYFQFRVKQTVTIGMYDRSSSQC